MADNSRNCKWWSVILLSAALVAAAMAGKPFVALAMVLPLLALGLLDTYYLSLERGFRDSYSQILDKLREDSYTQLDFGRVRPEPCGICEFVECLRSPSVWLCYPALIITAILFTAMQLTR